MPAPARNTTGRHRLVRLEWGMYLFAPSISALKALRDRAATVGAGPVGLPWSASDGLRLLTRLEAEAEADPPCAVALWKAALEDPDERRYFRSASIWAAIREHRGGVLRTPYGVLVADTQRVMEVFANAQDRYTMQQHRDDRMAPSIGEIYLGLDAGAAYKKQADATNRAIRKLSVEDGFVLAHEATRVFLHNAIQGTIAQAIHFGLPSWELNLDVKEISDHMLQRASEAWLGLPTADNAAVQGRRLPLGLETGSATADPRAPDGTIALHLPAASGGGRAPHRHRVRARIAPGCAGPCAGAAKRRHHAGQAPGQGHLLGISGTR